MILQNAVKITEGEKVTYLPSVHRHDFRAHDFPDGSYFAVDGGTDYLRRVGNIPQGVLVEEFNLTKEDSDETIAERALWGTLGKDGKGPLTYLPISELELAHVANIWLDYSNRLGEAQRIAVIKRLEQE